MRSLIQSFREPSIFLTILSRGWSVLVAPVTLAVVASSLSEVDQGLYYAFASLLGLNIVLELGLSQTVLTYVSQESAYLEHSRGISFSDGLSAARVVSFMKATMWVYFAAACLSFIFVGGVGGFILSRGQTPKLFWMMPWLLLVFVSAVQLFLNPLFIMVEALGCVPEVVRARFVRQVFTSISGILLLYFGFGLYSVPMVGLIGLIVYVWMLLSPRWQMLQQIAQAAAGEGFLELKRLAFYQVKIAVSWICGYLIFSFYVPMIYMWLGPVEAGKFGMSWTIMSTIIMTGSSLIALRLPEAGRLIGAGRREDAKSEVAKGVHLGLALCCGGGGLAIVGAIYLHSLADFFGFVFLQRTAERLVSPLGFTFLLIGGVAYIYTNGIVSYVRAFKVEPFMGFSLLMLALTFVGTWLGAKLSLVYVCASYCGVQWAALPYAVYLSRAALPPVPRATL